MSRNQKSCTRKSPQVIRANGLYISQHKQPGSLQATVTPNAAGRYELLEPYYRHGALPAVENSPQPRTGNTGIPASLERTAGRVMSRRFCVIQDLSEPCHATVDATHGSFAHRSQFVAPYVVSKLVATRVLHLEPKHHQVLGIFGCRNKNCYCTLATCRHAPVTRLVLNCSTNERSEQRMALIGRLLNSGWNCTAKNHGWSGNSTISIND